MSSIYIQNLTKKFSDKTVLEGTNLTIDEGGFVCIMGNSGCGKTTLINIILGHEQADSGTVIGVPKKISAVYQEDRLCEDFSALSNVAMVINSEGAKATAKATLCALGLGDALNKPVKKLSGGMKRRVATARALVADAELVVMDEPFKGLDDETKESVICYVHKVLNGKTVLLVTHDAAEAYKLGALLYQMKSKGVIERIN